MYGLRSITWSEFYGGKDDRKMEEKKETFNEMVDDLRKVLLFDNAIEATRFYVSLLKEAENNKEISVHDLYFLRDRHCDYTWDGYGWASEDIFSDRCTLSRAPYSCTQWVINLPVPRRLDREWAAERKKKEEAKNWEDAEQKKKEVKKPEDAEQKKNYYNIELWKGDHDDALTLYISSTNADCMQTIHEFASRLIHRHIRVERSLE